MDRIKMAASVKEDQRTKKAISANLLKSEINNNEDVKGTPSGENGTQHWYPRIVGT